MPKAANDNGPRIILGVTGGIATYKSPDLVRRLRERGEERSPAPLVAPEGAATPRGLVLAASSEER